jgi:hypothetical protein
VQRPCHTEAPGRNPHILGVRGPCVNREPRPSRVGPDAPPDAVRFVTGDGADHVGSVATGRSRMPPTASIARLAVHPGQAWPPGPVRHPERPREAGRYRVASGLSSQCRARGARVAEPGRPRTRGG